MYRKQNLDMTRYRGLSTDTKPDADFGSTFHEMDTGDIYRFDGSEWQKCGSLAGTDPSIYMSMWGARGNTKKAWTLSTLAGGHSDPGILKTVTGNPISISDALAAPIQSLSVSLSPIQEGSGDPSPDNVRPITGRTEVTAWRTGKNLFNKTTVTPTRFVSADGTLAYSAKYAASDYIPVKAGVSMIVSGLTASSAAIKTAFYDREKVFISAVSQNKPTYSFTTPSGAEYARITVPNADLDTAQLEIGSTLSDYAPYDGTSVTIQLGQTVYGGTVDVTGGKVHVTHELVDMSTIPWSPYAASSPYVGAAYCYFESTAYALPEIDDTAVMSNLFINRGSTAARDTMYTFGFVTVHPYIWSVLYDGEYHTCAEWQAKFAEMGAKVILPLAEPFDITLDPASLSTLRGDNTVWSDGDDISMTYKAVSL